MKKLYVYCQILIFVLFAGSFASADKELCKTLFIKSPDLQVANSLNTDNVEPTGEQTMLALPHDNLVGPAPLKKTTLSIDHEQIESLSDSELALYMARLMLNTPSQSGIEKKSLQVGLIQDQGYSVQVKYKSHAVIENIYVLDDIEILTPTGNKYKIADNLIEDENFRLKNSSAIELPKSLKAQLDFHVQVPLVLKKEVADRINQLSRYFEYADKEDLKKIFESSKYYRTAKYKLQFLYIKKEFKKQLITRPFKILSTVLVIGGFVAFTQADYRQNMMDYVDLTSLTRNPTVWVGTAVDDMQHLPLSSQMKLELSDLKKEILLAKNQKIEMNPNLPSVAFSNRFVIDHKFSENSQIWIFESTTTNGQHSKTFLVITDTDGSNAFGSIKYFIMPIDTEKYKNVIQFLKMQGKVLK